MTPTTPHDTPQSAYLNYPSSRKRHKSSQIVTLFSPFLFLALPAGCSSAHPSDDAPPGYHLVFSDDFSHPGPPDPANWSCELGMLRNHEAQLYTDHNALVITTPDPTTTSPSKAESDRPRSGLTPDGCLLIEARKEDAPVPRHADRTAHFTSASLESKQSWTYARVEVRAKIPMARGTWPAIWFLGDSIRTGTRWPLCGEIDLMEHVGHDPLRIHQSIHTQSYNHVKHTQKTAITPIDRLDSDFHTYTLDWTPEKIEMSIDGTKRFTFQNEHKTDAEWPFDKPQYLKLNLAIGGDWGGQQGIDENAFPQQFLIDYVRVYRRNDSK